MIAAARLNTRKVTIIMEDISQRLFHIEERIEETEKSMSKIVTDLSLIDERLKEYINNVNCLDVEINGNGKPGLKQDVLSLKHELTLGMATIDKRLSVVEEFMKGTKNIGWAIFVVLLGLVLTALWNIIITHPIIE